MIDMSLTVKYRVLQYLRQYGEGTTQTIGHRVYTNDVRKAISDLRKMGYDIRDRTMDGKRIKTYWLVEDDLKAG